MRGLSHESLEARLRTIASTASDHLSAQSDALEVLEQAVGFDVGVFSTVDPATLLWTSCVLYGLDVDPDREAFAFENEYRRDDLHKISELVRGPERALRLSAADHDAREKSPRYRMMTRMGVGDELRCALMEGGNCWGSLELYRSSGAGPFRDEEVRGIEALSETLAHLVRAGLLRVAASRPDAVEDPPGVVLFDGNGDVEAMSPAAQRWSRELRPDGRLPPSIQALAMRLRARTGESISMSLPRASGGWLRLHAARLPSGAEEKTSIVIEPVRPTVLAATVAKLYGFTPRECEVIGMLARGFRAKEIAARLDLSPYTVHDHSKSVFRKAGVESRQQLVAALFFDHCLPRRRNGAVPGPYGWFLDDEPGEGPRPPAARKA